MLDAGDRSWTTVLLPQARKGPACRVSFPGQNVWLMALHLRIPPSCRYHLAMPCTFQIFDLRHLTGTAASSHLQSVQMWDTASADSRMLGCALHQPMEGEVPATPASIESGEGLLAPGFLGSIPHRRAGVRLSATGRRSSMQQRPPTLDTVPSSGDHMHLSAPDLGCESRQI